MQWFRWYTGTATDPKFLLVARLSGQNVAAVVAVWAMLLERASEGQEGKDALAESGGRGGISGFDCDAADVVLGLEGGSARAVVEALRARGLLSGERVTNWDKRQPRREDPSTERVRRFRERQRRERAAAVSASGASGGAQAVGTGPGAWGKTQGAHETGPGAGDWPVGEPGTGEASGLSTGEAISAAGASGALVPATFAEDVSVSGAAPVSAAAFEEAAPASGAVPVSAAEFEEAGPASGHGNAGKRTETPEERRREEIPLLSSLRSESMPPSGAARRKRAEGGLVSRRPPSVEEVRAYCEERGNGVSAGHFVDYYAAQGWRLSNGRAMRDWKAAVRNWEHRDAARSGERGGAGSSGRAAAGRVRLSEAEARQRHNDEVCRQVAAELEAQGGF